MKPKLIVVLALIVLTPLAVVAWLGAKALRDEQALRELGFRELMLGQLRAVDAVIVGALDAYRERLLDEMRPFTTETEELRERSRTSPYTVQLYVLDAEDRLVYPALRASSEWSQSERASLERTRHIWDGGEISHELVRLPDTPSKAAAFGEARWHSWYRDRGVQLMLWIPEGDAIHAAEANRTRLLADIVAALPETDALAPELAEGQVRLLDAAGRAIYQWGAVEPEEDAAPNVEIAVSEPLAGWRLQYYASSSVAGAALEGASWRRGPAPAALLALGVLGLAFYFYREQAREMREAAQRVSFVNQVSHELKTPLTNIRMYAELLDRDVEERESQPESDRLRRYLDVIVVESQRLSRLIANVLSFSRSQRQALEIRRQTGVLDEVVRKTVDQFQPALAAKDLEVRFSAGAPEPVSFDADALEQILGNLLSNAEKYASTGGPIEVRSEQQGGRVAITVQDSGPGLSEAEVERIFEPFYRVHNRLTEGVSGTGIGLAISRELARMHGGDLELAPSERGACFRLTIEG